MVSEAGRKYFQLLSQNEAFGASGFDLDGLRQCMAMRREPTVDGVRCVAAEVNGLPAEWVVAEDADPDVRFLYLHGGGFVSGSAAFYLAMAAHLAVAARCAILLPDYRLAPEHPFPAALEDCVAAHQWLRANGPAGPAPATATFIGGDSAGGGLTLAALLVMRDRGAPLPAAAVAISPFADLTMSGASYRTEAETDPIMHPRCLPRFVELYHGSAATDHPLMSPAFGEYSGVPPLLLQVGEHEVLRDDSVAVAARARAAGVDVTLEIWPGMFHVFHSHEPLLPEARDAIGHIAALIRRCTPENLSAAKRTT